VAKTLLTLNRHTEKRRGRYDSSRSELRASFELLESLMRKTSENMQELVPEVFLDFFPLREPRSAEHECCKAAITSREA